MNKIIRKCIPYITAVSFCCTAISCKKLIEVPPNPTDRIASSQAFADSSNVLSILAGIYNEFQIVDQAAAPGFMNGALTVFTGLSSDELINRNLNYFPFLHPYYSNSLLPTDGYLGPAWQNGYKIIYMVNVSLENLPLSKGLTEGFRQRTMGELKTIRAWVYFNLLQLFGGMPLVTGTDYRKNAILPRSTADETYALIIADLEDAITLLGDEYPSAGRARPNIFVAKALLAKVYLYRNNWQKAAELSGDVIDAGIYELEADLNNVFLAGSLEAVWQYPCEGASYSETNEGYIFNPAVDTYPDFEVTPALLDAFQPGDQRKIDWIEEIEVFGITYIYPHKYKKSSPDVSERREDYMLLRIAEQYLIRAEARAHLDQTEGAVEDLNVIRSRAGLGEIVFSDMETLLADIMQERRVELFAEWGNRWGDLKRTGLANVVLGAKPNWQPTDTIFPIPLQELQNNPFLQQNPGY